MRQNDAALTISPNGNPAGDPAASPPGDATLTGEQPVTGQRPHIQTTQIFTGQAMGCSAHTEINSEFLIGVIALPTGPHWVEDAVRITHLHI